jgi:plastocyanin
MQKYGAISAISLMAIACVLAACAGRGGGAPNAGGNTAVIPFGPGTVLEAVLPKNTIGEELPTEGVGTEKDPKWGTVGGFTQSTKAQVLAFPPGTTVTLRNLSHSLPHTLDAFKKVIHPPANFPANPILSIPKKGNGMLAVGYASGAISPGKSVTIKLSKPGDYLIGCAFHYSEGMKDVIRVIAGATPGPQTVR